MKEVEEELRQGLASGELEEKQNRILSRLLDAQRSVNRRDFDPQRESRPGEDLSAPSAPARARWNDSIDGVAEPSTTSAASPRPRSTARSRPL